ncbi:hypothetical protein SAMN05444487_11816 [Marininema mesophilum]|uniref:Uncharacterized protein n=1 Tax=Marininema mesophilum TaxID=1048340 RepID=A0A1H3BSU0_9BACL|nr:hypothetical protein [Marininema mesophilum]SDX44846.1 hypothetical protein SAMN05444487_11816 [Marininema mesophilum]
MTKPFEVIHEETVAAVSSILQESGLPAGALALMMEEVVQALRVEARRRVATWQEQSAKKQIEEA